MNEMRKIEKKIILIIEKRMFCFRSKSWILFIDVANQTFLLNDGKRFSLKIQLDFVTEKHNFNLIILNHKKLN